MKIIPFTDASDHLVHLLRLTYDSRDNSGYIKGLIEKVNECNCRVVLVSSYPPEGQYLKRYPGDPEVILKLHDAWQHRLRSSDEMKGSTEKIWREINQFGQSVIGEKENLAYAIFQSLQDESGNTYFLLLPDQASFDPFLQSLFTIALLWHLRRGEFPLHASAVRLGEHLLLFSGPSDIGKTTIARLLAGHGGELIDEDRVLVRMESDGKYYARGWGYSLTRCDVPIRAIFRLEQSDHPQVDRISQMELASFLISRSQEVVHHPYPDEVFMPLFKFISKMTHHVPGYHLQFEKSLSFWEHIERALNI